MSTEDALRKVADRQTGTIHELRLLRRAWRNLEQAGGSMARLGPAYAEAADQLLNDAGDLGHREFMVLIPCMFCRRSFPEPVKIAAEGEPASCICGDCNDAIEDAIVAEHPDYERLADAIKRRKAARGELSP